MEILSSSSINSLINNFKYSETVKKITPLQNKKSKASNLSSAWGQLKTKLTALKSSLSDIKSASSNIFDAKVAELSNSDYFTATSTTAAKINSYELKIDQLAKRDMILSDTVTSDNLSGLSAGTYSFNISSGSYDDTINVELTGTETLKEMMTMVAEAINQSSDGAITASVFSPKTGEAKLSINSAETGSINSVSLTDNSGNMLDTVGLNLVSRTLTSGSSGGYSNLITELDAKFKFNGVDIERSSNIVNDLIEGVTLTLTNPMDADTANVNLTVKYDLESIKTDINGFIDKFNSVFNYIKENYKSNENGRGLFVGNNSALSLKQNFATISYSQISGLPEGDYSSLKEIGIEFDPNNGLSISEPDVLDEALDANPDQVSAIFGSSNGIAQQLYDVVDNYVGVDGVISNLIDSYDSSVSYLNKKITHKQEQIDKSVLVLRRQYEKLQLQLADLYSSQNYFSSTSYFG